MRAGAGERPAGRRVLIVESGGHSVRRRLAANDGYSLPELLVAMVIGLLVSAAGATMVIVALQTQPRATERAAQIQQGRVLLETITRELRQGESIVSVSPSGLELLTYVPVASCGGETGAARICRVSYACDATSCARTEYPDDGGTASARTVVSGISGPEVFSFQGDPTDPSFVGVSLVFPQESGEESVTLADGAALRNHFESDAGA